MRAPKVDQFFKAVKTVGLLKMNGLVNMETIKSNCVTSAYPINYKKIGRSSRTTKYLKT